MFSPALVRPAFSSAPPQLRRVPSDTIPLVRGLPVIYYPHAAIFAAATMRSHFLGEPRIMGVRKQWDPWGFDTFNHHVFAQCSFCRRHTRYLIMADRGWACRGCGGRRLHGPNCKGGSSPEGCRRRLDTVYQSDWYAGLLLFMLRIGFRGGLSQAYYRKLALAAGKVMETGRKSSDYDRLRRAAEVLQYDPRGRAESLYAARSLPEGFRTQMLLAWVDAWHPWGYYGRCQREALDVGGVYIPAPAFLDQERATP